MHLLVIPERHLSNFREIAHSLPRRRRASARLRRRYGGDGGARGLPGHRERRPRRRPDRLPPALAHPRRPGAAVPVIARIEAELKDAMRARDEPRVATLRLTLTALCARREGAAATAEGGRGAAGPPARAQAAGGVDQGVPRRGPGGAGRPGGDRAYRARGAAAGAGVRGRARADRRRRDRREPGRRRSATSVVSWPT